MGELAISWPCKVTCLAAFKFTEISAGAMVFGMKIFQLLLALLLAGGSAFNLAWAQETTTAADAGSGDEIVAETVVAETGRAAGLPTGVPKLPEPRSGPGGLLLSPKNAQLFNQLLLAPMASWLEARLFAGRVFSKLDFAWDYSPQWSEATLHNSLTYQLGEQQNLVRSELPDGEEHLVGGFPFGRAADIDQETDAVAKAYKILWNVASIEGAVTDTLYEGELAWIGTQSLLKSSEAILYRRTILEPLPLPPSTTAVPPAADKNSAVVAPEQLPAQNPLPEKDGGRAAAPDVTISEAGDSRGQLANSSRPDILRQELFRISAPPVVYGLAEIYWRYRGAEEDRGWIVSPVTGKSRSAFASNRSDGLVGGILTADDLFTWSAKVQSVEAKVLAEKVVLVPFPAVVPYQIGSASDGPNDSNSVNSASGVLSVRGYHQRLDGQAAMALWNHQTRQYPGLAPWLPTTAYFVPREVWILELKPRDPYYNSGREILIVDKRSMLPVYKLVYNQSGEYSRIVITGWGLASTTDSKVSFPFAGFVFAVDRGARRAMSFTPRVVRTFINQRAAAAVELQKLLNIEQHDIEKAQPIDDQESKLTEDSPERLPQLRPQEIVDEVEVPQAVVEDQESEADFLP